MKNETVNILSIVPYKFLPPQMGGQRCIALLNRYLSKHNKLQCVSVKDNNTSYEQEYTVYNILNNSKLRYINPFYFFTIKRFIRQHNITHLIIEHPYYGWLGILLKWGCKVKLVIRSHNIESLRFRSMDKWWWGILWHYEKFAHRNADCNFFIQDEDKNYAINNYKLDPVKCATITYGFELTQPPTTAEKLAAREFICKEHRIAASEKILLFNGMLGYKPNLDAVDVILEKINPVLLAEPAFNYKIIICGNKLPANYAGLANYREKNVIYAGFVEDISLYFKGSDIFINPVITGGGIKTKLVEALGYDLSVVSTQTGAIGIDTAITGNKMKLIKDEEWAVFAKQVIEMNAGITTPVAFYHEFYWGKIAEKATSKLQDL